MTLEDLTNEIGNQVYLATSIVERAEGKRLIVGNGHHIRQALARQAQLLVAERWADKDELAQWRSQADWRRPCPNTL